MNIRAVEAVQYEQHEIILEMLNTLLQSVLATVMTIINHAGHLGTFQHLGHVLL